MMGPESEFPVEMVREGVALEKHFDETYYELPSIVYEFTSERSEPVSIHLEETFHDELDVSNVGFHSAYGKEHWTVDGQTVVFEYELDPDAEYRTICVVRQEISDGGDGVPTEPDVFEVEPGLAESVADPSSAAFPRSAGTDVAETDPDEEAGDSDDGAETRDRRPTAGNGGREDGSPVSTDEEVRGEDHTSNADDTIIRLEEEHVGDRLVSELRDGRLSEDSVRFLRDELSRARDPPRSTEAKIRQLQSEFADLKAYTNALGRFLDEDGGAQEIVGEFEDRLASMEDEIESLHATVDEQETALEELSETDAELERTVEKVSTDVESIGSDLDDLSADLSREESELPEDDLVGRITEIESRLDEVSGLVGDIRSVFQK